MNFNLCLPDMTLFGGDDDEDEIILPNLLLVTVLDMSCVAFDAYQALPSIGSSQQSRLNKYS